MRITFAAVMIFFVSNLSVAEQLQITDTPAGITTNSEESDADAKVKAAEKLLAEAKAEQAAAAQRKANAKAKIETGTAAIEKKSEVPPPPPPPPINENEFWNDWGVGLSVSTKLGKKGRALDEAQLVNGIVRVTSERDVVPRLMLERHWYLQDSDFAGGMAGVFVGTSLLGDKKLLDSVSLGLIWGFKPRGGNKVRHNIGVGIAVEPYSRTLGDGLEINAPLPAGETSIRYKERNRMAAVVFYTFTP
ncbi:hypothetical protein [Janthinobacterium sp. 78]|uniref:hypothetical protein n=1 Tax=Janthinobacterium sp. 78 TaxID=2135631 RepID=UPI000D5E82AD|nr:hypothetical protein [Janthinobacterium sp. 78]PVX36798.1 hypothetical protein C8C92_3420 [Janthinobacterium sp. 78]